MSQMKFKNLWLVSERDRRGRHIPLEKQKILLLGPNGTGKSRIVKNIFWALGSTPTKWNAGGWDPDTIAALEFSVDEKTYTVVRAGKAIGLYDEVGKNIFASTNHSAWSAYTANLFRYRLKLQRNKTNAYYPAGFDYLAVPYYIDQDGSWGVSWSTFTTLARFEGWRPPVFASFTGLRPNVYLEAKQKRDEAKSRLLASQKDLESQQQAFRRVRDNLPKNLPSLDLSSFRAELSEMAAKAKKIQQKQVDTRAQLLALINQRQQLEAQLKLAVGSHRELVKDLNYLSAIPDTTDLECPTCGTLHQTSFHARLTLTKDADSMAAFVAQLNKQLESTRIKESEVRKELRQIELEVERFDKLSHEKKARLKLDEVLTSHSKRTIDKVFRDVTISLTEKVDKLEEEVGALQAEMKKYEDRTRSKEVSDYYAVKLRNLSDALRIPEDERVDATKLGARPSSGGSSGPRAVLAVHLAMLATNVEHGDTIRLPFVVDTPQQSGQDEDSLRRMISVIESHAAPDHQLILAVERLPSDIDVSGFEILRFNESQKLLRKEDFEAVTEKLHVFFRHLKAKVAEEARNEAMDARNVIDATSPETEE